LDALAVVFDKPELLTLRRLPLTAAADSDVVVAVEYTSISAGTERLLWTGRMPPFPGLGYPLVPGYEAVGRVVQAGASSGRHEGELVFVPGANCFGDVKGLFGGAASRLVVPGARVIPIVDSLGERAVLLALAATAYHGLVGPAATGLPDLIIGHGTFGRLAARIVKALKPDADPVVWEKDPRRAVGAHGYRVMSAEQDARRDYTCIFEASGDASLLEPMLGRLRKGGEIVLAGFYSDPITFRFPLAFMKEARLRVAAEWGPNDLAAVTQLVNDGVLSFDGLITHERDARHANDAYGIAFGDPTCIKMILDWRQCA
jgi:3-hydroxyethyl bacteriochlorophyllide a dehydrogenase